MARNGHRRLSYEDLGCNGAFTVFDSTRDLLDVARDHLRFFVEESCGICVPCRAGNPALLDMPPASATGGPTRRTSPTSSRGRRCCGRTSRCGLGVSSSRPLTTTLSDFPELAASARGAGRDSALLASFDEQAAVAAYRPIAERLTAAREDGRDS